MTGFMKTARARTRTFLTASAVVVVVLVAATALLVGQGLASVARTQADHQAAHEVDLLGTVGASFPNLTPSVLAHGLSPTAAHLLDEVATRVQHDGLLASIEIWNRSGLVVYSTVAAAEGTRPPKQAELVAALAGHSVTGTHLNEIDGSGERTGVLDALKPLISDRGVVYGALEVSLPLKAVDTAAARVQRRGVLIVIGAAALLCLLALPLWLRVARSQADDWIPRRRKTLRAFRAALEQGAVELVYQPQVEPDSRRVAGVEALVRWRRNGKLVPPDEFLAAVESSALMSRLTDRVFDLALAQIALWQRAEIMVRVSVNLSATDLADGTLPRRIAAKLDLHGVTGDHLTVEVTETAILQDAGQARVILGALDQMGIDIALDDFGTGHASISRLHQLPVFSELKIDRSFASDTQPRSKNYLGAMVAFGRSLGLRVVAEGVDDDETLANLAALDCDLAQGYLISRPLEPIAMTRWLTTHSTGQAATGRQSASTGRTAL
jgi:EAL domain-containing protein (putative c-di-GMP-specific phosphodiesterase class I)